MTPEIDAAATGELVLSPAVVPGRSRRAWTRLVRFVSRAPSGRHRPGTLDTDWSMFAPPRPRSGRRRGAGT